MITIKQLSLRKFIKVAVPFAVVPAIVILGALMPGDKIYAFVSLAVTVFAFLLFISGFEKKQTGARRLVIVSVMIALSVAGRFIPFFKPITALTVITAIYFGSEAGFLTGSLSALISNFYFGQGPWTPFQMFAWGMIGLLAGFMSLSLKKSRALLVIYGLISGMAFSFIMDIWTVLWYNDGFSFSLYTSAIVTAIPFALLYSVSNAIFLILFARPFGEKLERLKLKYGV